MTTGKTFTHWLILRSHDDPTADDILSGQVGLGTDGSTVYMTTDDGTVTPINGSAVMKDITLDDDAAAEFQVRQASDTYLLADTTDGSEVMKVGNSTIAALTTQIQGVTIDMDASGDMTIDAGGTLDLVAVGVATIQGGSINLGGAGNGDILIGSTGTRDIDIGSVNATEVTLETSGASIELTATGMEHLVATNQTWTMGRTGVDYLVVDDSAGTFAVLSTMLVDASEVQVTGDITVTGSVDGVDLSTLASIANGEGCSQLGVEDAGTYFAGADVEAVLQEIGSSLGGVPANASDLADVDTSGASDKDLFWYVNGDSEWQPVAPATAAAEIDIGDLANVDGAASPTDGQFLAYHTGTGLWGPIAVPSLDDLTDINASSPSEGEVLTWDSGAGEWVASASAVTGGAKSEFEPSPLSTEGVYEIHSDIDQEILTSEGARIHISFSASITRTGTPTGELRLGVILEDSGGTPAAYFATNEDLGGDTDIEVSGQITLSVGEADSADSGERNIYVSGSCLRAVDGAAIHSMIRKYDGSGHAPVSFPGGLKFSDLSTSDNHLRFVALTDDNSHDPSNRYNVSLLSIVIDMFEG